MKKALALRTQLLLIVGTPLLLLLVVESIVSYRIGSHITNQVFDRWLLDSANSLVQEIRTTDGAVSFIADDAAVEAFSFDELDEFYYHITTISGDFIAGHPELDVTPDIDLLQAGPTFNDPVVHDERTRSVSVLAWPEAIPSVIVTVAETLNKRQAMTGELLFEVLLSKVILVIAVLLIISVAFKRGLGPLTRISSELSQRSPQDLTPIGVGDVPQELQGLIRNTNQLFERIDSAMNSREQFIGNIAHQIRTPLAGMKLQAQLALHEASSTESVTTALERIVGAADQMAHVNSQLMKLARAESALGRGLRAEQVNLVAVLRNCCAELTTLTHERGITLLQNLPDHPVVVPGELTLISEMVGNLLENAIIYGNSGGHVWLHLEENETGPRIDIDDDGPGIAREHWPRIFDRFFRPVPECGNGCGLGLSIVREIAMAHDASVYLEERETGTGIRFVIQFHRQRS